MNTLTKKEGGYIALISAIVISAVLLIITFSANFSSFFARFNILDSEYKKVSVGLAEACVDIAMLEIAKGNTPADDTCVNVGDSCPGDINQTKRICKICEVDEPTTDKFEIKTKAVYQKSATNLLVKVTKSPTTTDVTAWEEVTGNAGCTIP